MHHDHASDALDDAFGGDALVGGHVQQLVQRYARLLDVVDRLVFGG
jgi:hypothetical protein